MRSHRAVWFALGWVGLLLSSGCTATKGFLNWSREKVPEASAENPVVRMVCIWEPAEGRGLDGLPTRGFAGQIMFFTAGEASPVRAEGDVRIYLYDDHGTKAQQAKPLHQFDYVNGAWGTHLRLGMLGPVYQVFIPYVRKHPYRAKCALRVRLQPKYGGPPVYSEVVTVTLPGPEPKQAEEEQQQEKGSGTQKPQLSIRRFSVPLKAGAENAAASLPAAGETLSAEKAPAGQVSPQRVQELLQRLQGHTLRPAGRQLQETKRATSSSPPEVLSTLSAPGPVVLSEPGTSARSNQLGKALQIESPKGAVPLSRRFQLQPAQ